MNNRLSQAQKRAAGYWFVDGIVDIGAGLLLLLVAGYLLAQPALENSPALQALAFALLFGLAFAGRWLAGKWKASSTYPRTGYVAPPSIKLRSRGTAAALTAAIVLLALALYINTALPHSAVQVTRFAAVLLAFLFAWTGFVAALPRLFVLAAAVLVAGFLLPAAALLPPYGDAALLVGLAGAALLVFGVVERVMYLKHHPADGEEVDGR